MIKTSKNMRWLFILVLALTCYGCDEYKHKPTQPEQNLSDHIQHHFIDQTDCVPTASPQDSVLSQKRATNNLLVNKRLAGVWKAQIVCNRGDCNKWVIGDRVSQIWSFVSSPAGIYAITTDKLKHIQVLTGSFDGQVLTLHSIRKSYSGKPRTVYVQLVLKDRNFLCGSRKISFGGSCDAAFSVELQRQCAYDFPGSSITM